MKESRDSIVINAFFKVFSGLLGKVGSLVFTVLLARMLVPEVFGVYSLALSIILILVVLSDAGIQTTIVRYLSISNSNIEASSNLKFLLKMKVAVAVIFSIILFSFSGMIASFYSIPELALSLKIGSFYLFLTALYGIFAPIFLTYQKLKYSSFMEAVFQISRLVLVASLMLFYKNVFSIFLGLSLAALLTFLFGLIIVLKRYRFLLEKKKVPVSRRKMLEFSFFILLGSLGVIIFGNIDKLILGYFLEPKFLGYYTVIFTILSGAIGLFSFSGILLPNFSRLEGIKLKNLFQKSFGYFVILAIPATVGLAYLTLPFMRFLYGSEYVPLESLGTFFTLTAILAFLLLETVISGAYASYLNAREKPQIQAYAIISASVLNIFLNFVFILALINKGPIHALLGAGIATVLSRYLATGFMVVYTFVKFKTAPTLSSVLKPVIASIFMLGILIFLRPYFTQWKIFFLIVIGASSYFLILFLIKGFNYSELKYIIMHIFPKKIKTEDSIKG